MYKNYLPALWNMTAWMYKVMLGYRDHAGNKNCADHVKVYQNKLYHVAQHHSISTVIVLQVIYLYNTVQYKTTGSVFVKHNTTDIIQTAQ
jgi:hypothetical protein